jgi:hypothetical protein
VSANNNSEVEMFCDKCEITYAKEPYTIKKKKEERTVSKYWTLANNMQGKVFRVMWTDTWNFLWNASKK